MNLTMKVLEAVGVNLSGLDSDGDPCPNIPFLSYDADAVCDRTVITDRTLHQFWCGPFEGWSKSPIAVGSALCGWYPTTNELNGQGAMYFDRTVTAVGDGGRPEIEN